MCIDCEPCDSPYVAFTSAKERIILLTDNRHASSPFIAELELD